MWPYTYPSTHPNSQFCLTQALEAVRITAPQNYPQTWDLYPNKILFLMHSLCAGSSSSQSWVLSNEGSAISHSLCCIFQKLFTSFCRWRCFPLHGELSRTSNILGNEGDEGSCTTWKIFKGTKEEGTGKVPWVEVMYHFCSYFCFVELTHRAPGDYREVNIKGNTQILDEDGLSWLRSPALRGSPTFLPEHSRLSPVWPEWVYPTDHMDLHFCKTDPLIPMPKPQPLLSSPWTPSLSVYKLYPFSKFRSNIPSSMKLSQTPHFSISFLLKQPVWYVAEVLAIKQKVAAITAQRISALPNARQRQILQGLQMGRLNAARLLSIPPGHWSLSSPTPAPQPFVSAFHQLSLAFVENSTVWLRVDQIHPAPSLTMEKI